MSAIVVSGRDVPCAAPVATWRSVPERSFPIATRRKETRAVVWHWTGSDNGAGVIHRTLRERSLSVHFAIDCEGLITQYVDADAFCAHAKGANAFTVGVEIANRADARAHINKGVPRALVRETIHGVDTVATTFLPIQVRSALALAESLSVAYSLPLAVPMNGADVIAGVLPAPLLAAFRGHIGHFHLSRQKRDCGLALLRAIAARGMGLRGKRFGSGDDVFENAE